MEKELKPITFGDEEITPDMIEKIMEERKEMIYGDLIAEISRFLLRIKAHYIIQETEDNKGKIKLMRTINKKPTWDLAQVILNDCYKILKTKKNKRLANVVDLEILKIEIHHLSEEEDFNTLKTTKNQPTWGFMASLLSKCRSELEKYKHKTEKKF